MTTCILFAVYQVVGRGLQPFKIFEQLQGVGCVFAVSCPAFSGLVCGG